jgi:hypothetical protein
MVWIDTFGWVRAAGVLGVGVLLDVEILLYCQQHPRWRLDIWARLVHHLWNFDWGAVQYQVGDL